MGTRNQGPMMGSRICIGQATSLRFFPTWLAEGGGIEVGERRESRPMEEYVGTMYGAYAQLRRSEAVAHCDRGVLEAIASDSSIGSSNF